MSCKQWRPNECTTNKRCLYACLLSLSTSSLSFNKMRPCSKSPSFAWFIWSCAVYTYKYDRITTIHVMLVYEHSNKVNVPKSCGIMHIGVECASNCIKTEYQTFIFSNNLFFICTSERFARELFGHPLVILYIGNIISFDHQFNTPSRTISRN